MPRFCELIVNFGKEGGRALAEGLMAPREKPLVQPAARWLLRQRPLEPKLVDSFCHNADVLHFIVTRTERDHVTRSRGGTLIVLSEEDGRMLSLWWWRGTRALSRSELVTGHTNHLPHCFFLTGPWEEENGRVRGAELLSEKKAIRERREARLKLSQWE